jgi:hypothetical protein
MVWSTNMYAFRGFAAGEVIFIGARGARRGDGNWEVTFRFAAMKNQTNIQVDDIEGIAKKGWEYMWTYYKLLRHEDTGLVYKKPWAVYVEHVYPT